MTTCENFTDCPYESFRHPCPYPDCENHQPMSDTNDLREQVARAMFLLKYGETDSAIQDWNERWGGRGGSNPYTNAADAALAVAEPLIRADERRKVIEELVTQAGDRDVLPLNGFIHGAVPLADWLRAQKENDHE